MFAERIRGTVGVFSRHGGFASEDAADNWTRRATARFPKRSADAVPTQTTPTTRGSVTGGARESPAPPPRRSRAPARSRSRFLRLALAPAPNAERCCRHACASALVIPQIGNGNGQGHGNGERPLACL